MPDHHGILSLSEVEQDRTIRRLLSLRSLLGVDAASPSPGKVPAKTMNKSLLLATWNLREFGANKKEGIRLPESLHYIAEIISAFDLIALQEVNENLGDFFRLMRILGPNYEFVLTDVTLGRRGNNERAAFVFDKRKVRFEGFAGQVVLPPEAKIGTKKIKLTGQLSRTPLMAGFSAGDFRFTVCSVHIYYGDSVPNDERRLQEIEAVAAYLAQRAESQHAWAPNMILLGDFNIFDVTDETARKLTSQNFFLPPQVARLPAGETKKNYDQIALYSKKYGPQIRKQSVKAAAGVVNFFEKVFIDSDERCDAGEYSEYFPAKKGAGSDAARRKYFRTWRTFQMSDHRPRWIELRADFATERLASWMHKLSRGEKLTPRHTHR